MTDYKRKTCLVVDQGLFVDFAATLAKDFGRLYYYVPWQTSYPKSNLKRIGYGLPGVTLIDSPFKVIDQVDIFVFPDVYQGALQEDLVARGKRVWGSRMGEELELDRVASKKQLAKLGIDIGPYQVVTGTDALREYLAKHERVYVKISSDRGDMETFFAKRLSLIEARIAKIDDRLGPFAKLLEFIVEDAIEPAVEVGYDGYVIDGKFAKNALYGIEIKDKGYVGRTKKYADLPEALRSVNEKMAPTLKDFGCSSFFSTEQRITKDGKSFAIDPCMRAGSPPSELYQVMISNLADIVWEGAGGTLVEPEYIAPWGALVMISSEWGSQDRGNWQEVEFPKSLVEHVKLRNHAILDSRHYVVPDDSSCAALGAVVAWGDSQQAAIDACKKIAEQVEGHHVEVAAESLDEAAGEIDTLKKFGIEF